MEARQVTVFGGSGFLGRYVVRALAKKGWRIKVATRHPNKAFFLRPMGQVGQIGFFKCDVADAGQVESALAGSHAVVNLTGILLPARPDLPGRACGGPRGHRRGRGAPRASRRWCMSRPSAPIANRIRITPRPRPKAKSACATPSRTPPSCGRRCCSGPKTVSSTALPRWRGIFPALPLIGGGRTLFQPVFVGDVAAAIVTALDAPACAGQDL